VWEMRKILILLILLTFSIFLNPQDLQHEVTVTLKLIQVTVTDKEGNPVTDLRKEDFILFDNNQERILTEFEKHNIHLPRGATTTAETKPLLEKRPLEPVQPILNRKFFLFFDFAWTDPQMVQKFRETALHFVDKSLLPTDEVSVLSFTGGRQLQVHFFQTTEHEKVRRFFGDLGLKETSRRAEDPEESYQRGLEAGDLPDSRPGAEMGLPFPDVAAGDPGAEVLLKSHHYLDNLTGLALALRYVPGQKHLMLISGGITPFIYEHPLLRFKAENLIQELNNSNVAVFSLRAAPMSMAPDFHTGAATLQKWATETGGKYFGNFFKADEHLEQIKILTSTYYVLGYSVSETWDGKYHKIKVKVSRPGCKVMAQKGYFNPKTFARYTDLEKEIHLIDLALAEMPLFQIPIRFQMTAQVCSFDNANNLLLAAHLPAEESAKISEGKAEIHSLIFDERDEIISHHRCEEDWPSLAGKEIYLLGSAGIPPGKYRCRIVIRDMETGKAAVAGFTTNVQSEEEKKFQIFPPLLLRQEKGAFYVRGMEATVRLTIPQSFEFADSHLIDTSSYIPFLGRTLAPETDLWASIRCSVPSGLDAGISLSAILFDKTMVEEIALPLEIIREKEEMGVKTFFVRVRIPNVEKDEYTLIFTAEHIASGNKTETACDYLISGEETSIGYKKFETIVRSR